MSPPYEEWSDEDLLRAFGRGQTRAFEALVNRHGTAIKRYAMRLLGNAELGPERTSELEFGFDGSFFQDRVQIDFTYYDQKTTDALFNVRQIPSLGFLASQAGNVGAIRNRGIEASINVNLIDQADYGLDIGSNFYTNKSLVLELGDAIPFGAGGGWVEEGLPVM